MTFSAIGFLIGVAPLLVLLAFLVGDRYPGERAIERVRRLLHVLASSRTAVASPSGRAFSPPAVRGGRLIACSLAGRGPPGSA